MKNLLVIFFLMTCLVSQGQTVTDIDGNIYNTVTVGTQTWTGENLKTSHFNNGDAIGTTSLAASNDSGSIYQWSYNEDSLNESIYGLLYTWFVVTDSRNVCPSGWHVPSDSDWIELSNLLGGDTLAGSKMKEAGTTHWLTTDSTVNNSSGFTGLPGGFRGNPTGFIGISTLGYFWSSTPWGSNSFPRAYNFKLQSTNSTLEESVAVANCGLSIRCLKDISAATENLFSVDSVRIFPNPAKDEINISFEEIGNFNFSIYNILGVSVLQKQLTNKTNLIDINFFPKGIYVIKIYGIGNGIVQKLIKE